MDDHNDDACVEGSDLPVESPLRAVLFGSQFASIPDGEYGGICCSGIAPLQRLGQKLIVLGVSPNRKLSIEKGGIHIGSATVGEATRTTEALWGGAGLRTASLALPPEARIAHGGPPSPSALPLNGRGPSEKLGPLCMARHG